MNRLIKQVGLILLIAFSGMMVVAPLVFDRADATLAYLILYFIALASSWNILSGFTGYINFGHAAFMGVGMYATAISIADFSLWWPLSWILGGVFAATFALIIGFPVLRTKGPYFAITMLAVAEGTRVLFGTKYLEPITRAGDGIAFSSGISFQTKYYGMLVTVALCVWVTYKISTSQFGLRLMAIREDEEAAESMGINSTRLKISAFTISAFFAGLAGGIHSTFLHYIDPFHTFNLQFTIIPIVMAVFGGVGTVLGPVIGGTVLQVLNDFIWAHFLQLNMAVFGVLLAALILFLPQGLLEWMKERRWIEKTRKI